MLYSLAELNDCIHSITLYRDPSIFLYYAFCINVMRIRNKRKTMNEYDWCWLVFTCCHFTRRIDKNKGRICNEFAFRAHPYIYICVSFSLSAMREFYHEFKVIFFDGTTIISGALKPFIPSQGQKYSRLLISTGNSQYIFLSFLFQLIFTLYLRAYVFTDFIKYINVK